MLCLVRRMLLIPCLAACITPAWTQPAKPLSALPAGAFQFQGSWGCAGSFANGKAHKSTYAGAVTVGGKWLQLTEQDVEPATGYIAEYLIGYDAQQKRLVEFDANNFGAAVYSSPDGWQNNVLTMSSDLSPDAKAPFAANRFIYTITASDSFTVNWQIEKTAASAWITSDHLVCRRVGPS